MKSRFTSSPPGNVNPRTNRLLSTLEPADYEELMREAKVVPLKFRKILLQQDMRIEAVYFPVTCMISLLVSADGQPKMEMATIGKEGVVGAEEIIQGQPAIGLHLVQIGGTAVRVKADAFRKLMGERPALQKVMLQHQHALMLQVLFGAACNRIHSMEERCARWLLMTHDRAGQDTFVLTQEFLSHMLGVRRATVNVATGMLKKAGFIRYTRGQVTVVDRAGLESAACECYRFITRIYDSLFPEVPKQGS